MKTLILFLATTILLSFFYLTYISGENLQKKNIENYNFQAKITKIDYIEPPVTQSLPDPSPPNTYPTPTLDTRTLHIDNPCIVQDQLITIVGSPYEPDIASARAYIDSNSDLEILEDLSQSNDQSGQLAIKITSDEHNGNYWIQKLTDDGFTSVAFYQFVGCDFEGN